MKTLPRALAVVALLSSVAPVPVKAQQYVISTYAGGAPPPTPAPAVAGSIGAPLGVATDAVGNIYFASSLNSVFKLDPSGALTRIAGNSRPGYSGDGGPATSARLRLGVCCVSAGAGLAVDSAGNLFIADSGNNRIRRVSPDGIVTTVAGGGTAGLGDGGAATSAQLNAPWGVAVDRVGNLFIADTWSGRIRKVSTSGIITTVAGGGTLSGVSADGGPATSAAGMGPTGVAVDDAGNLFIADHYSNRIRKVSPGGTITTVAGNGFSFCCSGDGGPATSALLNGAWGVAVDGTGNLFIAAGPVRKVSPGGIITTVAGGNTPSLGDGGPATSAGVFALNVALDGAGNVFIADISNARIRKVSASGIITTAAGDGTFGSSFAGDGGPAASARLNYPNGVAVDRGGNLFIADSNNNRIRQVSPSGIITTVAGSGTEGFAGDAGPATSARLGRPVGVAVDGAGNLFIADYANSRIRKVSPGGIITTMAGNGTEGFAGDGGPATSAQLRWPWGVAVDDAGNLFVADFGNNRIRRVSASGIITTVAGNGAYGFSGDGGAATSAQLYNPYGVAVDATGNLFIADSNNSRIRQVSPSGIITTVAGSGTWGSSGDGGPATSAHLGFPTGVAVDGAGNLLIADPGLNFDAGGDAPVSPADHRIRKVSRNGIITTLAGNGTFGFSGDGGPATGAQLYYPAGVAVDGSGNVYVADAANNVVRVVRPTNRSVLISAVVDAASQRADPVSPGKIVVVYGAGLAPAELSAEPEGTAVFFNGIPTYVLYTSGTQVAAEVPYAVSGTTAQVTVAYQGQVSDAFTVAVAVSAPSLFTLNQAGWGQAAAINAVDGTVNTAANPVRIGGFISLYATGQGQTGPWPPARPVLPVRVTVGGIPATVQYAGGVPGQVIGLMQVNVQIPSGVQPGGYVPVVLQVGDRTSSPAVWIAVSGN